MKDGIVTLEQTDMCRDTGHIDVYTETHSIREETLKMSFDGGKSWHEIKEVKARVEYCEKLTETTH